MGVADLGLPEGREGPEEKAVVGVDWRRLGGSLDGCLEVSVCFGERVL
jgi:hypothetical protein